MIPVEIKDNSPHNVDQHLELAGTSTLEIIQKATDSFETSNSKQSNILATALIKVSPL